MIVEINIWIIPLAALIPMVIGFIWYHPKVLGKAWMNVVGLTENDLQQGGMAKILILSYIFSCMLGFALLGMTIHQMGFQSMMIGSEGWTDPESPVRAMANKIMDAYGENYRSFRHGAFHGFLGGLFIAFSILATNALFERKSWKYIWINSSYWIISMMLMGGVICQFA